MIQPNQSPEPASIAADRSAIADPATIRRQISPLDAAGQFGDAVHDPTWGTAAFGHLSR